MRRLPPLERARCGSGSAPTVGGEQLHAWAFATRSFREHLGMNGGHGGVDDDMVARGNAGIGATIMGRNMFGPVRGAWGEPQWTGWWGDEPPFRHPVFVLTHHPRASFTMTGGTTFHFVTDGPETALARARDAAGDRDVRIGGGPATIRQFLEVRLIDELHVVVAPVLLGAGEPLFGGIAQLAEGYRCTELVQSETVTHFLLARR